MTLKKLTKISLFIVILFFVIITQSCGVSNEVTKRTGFYLNTSCTIEIHQMDKDKAEKIITDTFNLCQEYENQMSRTIEGSDIRKVNTSDGSPVEVNKETLELIEKSLSISKATDGDFDITVGLLSDLWNFTGENPKVPDKASLDEALSSVGYGNIVVDGNKISIKNKRAHLDLGAVAKGYIADKLVEYMEENGVESGILNLGGNIVTIGKKQGKDWKIGIELPYSHQTDIIGRVEVADKTIVTSGVFERYFEENGVEYHHVIDPKTGYPKNTDVVLVSIMSDKGNSVYCDLYSTTCLLLGKEKAKEFMKDKKGFEYCIVDTDNNITTSSGFNLIKSE